MKSRCDGEFADEASRLLAGDLCKAPHSTHPERARERVGLPATTREAHHISYGRHTCEWEATAMPTYAYRCEQCGKTFEQVETISEHGATRPPCPKCGSDKIASVPTAFVAMTGKKS